MPLSTGAASYVPAPHLRMTRRSQQHFRGCLLGGAVGDALGAPVEFRSLCAIRLRYGPLGISDFDEAYGAVGGITDDTQMTLFTAEGLLRAATRAEQKGISHPPSVVHRAYLRWLHTQGELLPTECEDEEMDGWLVGVRALHARRAPGNTCLSALRSGRLGSIREPINDSKGCGTVMRMAPVGLIPEPDAFRWACELGAITHGHPTGILAGGCFAEIIYQIIQGAPLREAIEASMRRLLSEPAHEECLDAIHRALAAVDDGASPEVIERLGGGWVAEESLAIAIYCSLVHPDAFEAAVRLAVNHGGDSDSTGAITGNLMGALLGVQAIPARWLDDLELCGVIETIADDLLVWRCDDPEWLDRYPGW